MVHPSGTVTFLFTDIEGSAQRWEADPEAIRSALVTHDQVLRSAVQRNGGWLFKHTGDGVCAAFSSANAAIAAAVEAQRGLALPVRMGAATGEAEERDGDYFGPPLNRAARVMAAGHGGQILVAASTAAVVDDADLVDLGEHRLRDLSGGARLFQVRAPGLGVEFPPLRTVDEVPGNLPVQVTSFVGRVGEVRELTELMGVHRLVTLTGMGGVGKTRLAVQVAAELTKEFPDGVWLVELAPLADATAVPDAVASVLGVTARAGLTVTDSIAGALSGRRLLLVLDNCEHVLGAAADLVEAILTRTATVRIMATSREGLGLRAEQLWPVPSLDVANGAESAAVELFVERARAVAPSFELIEASDVATVTEICLRLDGIALAIELAAARMVSMSPQDVRDRLDDRFRLLSGSQRAAERHQTLRHAVRWSYELLDDAEREREMLDRCSVFSDGFTVGSVTSVCADGADEYAVLDLLDSLVRKSLVTVERVGDHARYGMLETIRQFAGQELTATATGDEVLERHTRYFAEEANAHWAMWDGPDQLTALDWVEQEFANLRSAFRRAVDRGDLAGATAIAAPTAMLGWSLLRFEPVRWAEEILAAAAAADVRQLPRLYVAASLCSFTGRPEAALLYAQSAHALQTDPRYEALDPAWSSALEATAHRYAGRLDRWLEINASLAAGSGLARVFGLCGLTSVLVDVGRAEEARGIAEETLAEARDRRNPFFVAMALWGYGRAFSDTDPARALDALRQGLTFAHEHRLSIFEANIARHAAALEAAHGQLEQSLALFDTAIDALHRSGNHGDLAPTLAYLAVFFDRIERPDIAATIYGTSTHGIAWPTRSRHTTLDHLRVVLGETTFDQCVAAGAGMEPAEAVRYARQQIQLVRGHVAPRSPEPSDVNL